jgi:hypothetical protein
LKHQIRKQYGGTISLRGYGERLPDYNNYFEIDSENKDAYGIPQVRLHAGAKDNDVKMLADMYGWMEQILRACDAEILPYKQYVEPIGGRHS